MQNKVDELKTKIARNLKHYREKAGLTQLKLSLKLEVGVNYISEIERAIKTPSIKRLAMIAEILKVEPFELLK